MGDEAGVRVVGDEVGVRVVGVRVVGLRVEGLRVEGVEVGDVGEAGLDVGALPAVVQFKASPLKASKARKEM